MQSFRTELELVNHGKKALVEKDIIELAQKIGEFKQGTLPEDKFKSLRLARGVYGQRQKGVQMVRIKLPFGKISTKQLRKIADISDEYSNGNLHLTTRQDIQIHHVSLDKTPELWAKLEQEEITIREACGNTVRNITASAEAGILPGEPFDVSPYAQAAFEYFLRKPFGQELGRKFKIAFSADDKDTALSYIHDVGLIPKIKNKKKGFKVVIGGGLGAQPFLAQTAFEFLPESKLIPFIELSLRIFDRHGERTSRHKARLKYLINKIGLQEFINLVNEEQKTLNEKEFTVVADNSLFSFITKNPVSKIAPENDKVKYDLWIKTNTFSQKQSGYFGVYIKIQLGNISSQIARKLISIIEKYSDKEDVRITINQGLLLKFVAKEELPFLYYELNQIHLTAPGFDSTADITACPGIDTCNLAISNSTVTAKELEKVINEEYEELIYNRDIKIKISGCMNSCGQHSIAQIGFHGSSFKEGNKVVPALQLVLGGGTIGNGEGRIAEKVIKIASKRAPVLLRTLLNDYENNSGKEETFNVYYDRMGKDYFYRLLKHIADNSNLTENELYDWGATERYKTEIGVGECAGVMIDLVQTLFYEAEEKLVLSSEAIKEKRFSDAIYHSYSAFIHAAKGLLLNKGFHVNTHHALIKDFDSNFAGEISFETNKIFSEQVLEINKHEPTELFAKKYKKAATQFLKSVQEIKEKEIIITEKNN